MVKYNIKKLYLVGILSIIPFPLYYNFYFIDDGSGDFIYPLIGVLFLFGLWLLIMLTIGIVEKWCRN